MPSRFPGTLVESEERYRSVIAAMSEGVVLQAANSTILACNESAERLLGLDAEQMSGRSSYDPRWRAIHPDGSPFPGEDHPASVSLRTGLPVRGVEMGVHKPDGALTWISINAEPMFREGESKPYAVVTTFSDVTDRKRVELALRESEERYRNIVETSTVGIWTIDLEGRTVFANAAMARTLRCAPEDLARMSMWDFIDESDRPEVERRLRERESGVSEEHEFRFRARDGSLVWTSLSANPTTLPGGATGAMAMVRDITDQKKLLEQLQEARRLEAIGRLAGGVAHDFNNLITAILSSVWLAERHPESLSQQLATIRAASERAATLTNQLLAFARRQTIALRPLSLDTVVRELSPVLRRVVGEHIELAVELDSRGWLVLGDPSQLEQVLINLVANARDAMPDGGRVSIVTTTATLDEAEARVDPDARAGDYVLLGVRDTGSGMDEETRQHVFEPFYSTKVHGTGLGLASCYGIVTQLGGHIRVRSEPGKGSAFDVHLPRTLESAPDEVEPGAAMLVTGGHETILIAEDDPLVRENLRRALSDYGYSVLAAEDGERALSIAKDHPGPISLLVTDVVMPKLGGRQLSERLHVLRPSVRTLFVSGYVDEAVSRDSELGTPDHFLAKPYRMDELMRRVRELLDRP